MPPRWSSTVPARDACIQRLHLARWRPTAAAPRGCKPRHAACGLRGESLPPAVASMNYETPEE
jgi:hypothetical protein